MDSVKLFPLYISIQKWVLERVGSLEKSVKNAVINSCLILYSCLVNNSLVPFNHAMSSVRIMIAIKRASTK